MWLQYPAEDTDEKLMPIFESGLTDEQQRALLRDLVDVVKKYSPDWTDFNETDPGVTLMELFAFLLESLQYRSGEDLEPTRRRRLTELLDRLRADWS